jgi:hypothetical protein
MGLLSRAVPELLLLLRLTDWARGAAGRHSGRITRGLRNPAIHSLLLLLLRGNLLLSVSLLLLPPSGGRGIPRILHLPPGLLLHLLLGQRRRRRRSVLLLRRGRAPRARGCDSGAQQQQKQQY